MLNQHFSSRNFLRLLNRQDIFKYELGSGLDEFKEKFNIVEKELASKEFNFSSFAIKKMSHGVVLSPKTLTDDFALRKLNDNIKRVFNLKVTDRNSVLPQIKILLNEGVEFWIQKYDISKFFESIPAKKAIEIIIKDHRLSYESKSLLEKFFSTPEISSIPGLPRGISLSSTISELYMREFDTGCRRHSSCYFFTRYVDDILMLFHEQPDSELLGIDLPEGLSFHPAKTLSLYHPIKGPVKASDNSSKVTYLGYEFEFKSLNTNKPAKLQVGMSSKKIKKIKTRIALSLFDYCKNKNYNLLKSRLTFLASNYNIGKDSKRGKLYSGVYFNNFLIDSTRHSDLVSIDTFLRKAVCGSVKSLGRRLHPLLSVAQRRELMSISLKAGYEKKIVRKFTPERLQEIKRVWAHV